MFTVKYDMRMFSNYRPRPQEKPEMSIEIKGGNNGQARQAPNLKTRLGWESP